MWVLIASFLLAVASREVFGERDSPSTDAEKRGIIVTAPRVWLAGADEAVCVTFHGIDFEIRGHARLLSLLPGESTNEPLSEKIHVFHHGHGECFELPVPSGHSSLNFSFSAWSKNPGDYVFTKSMKVGIQQTSLALTFIQTDKPMYKPGQIVKFRILSVKPDLRPYMKPVEKVWIEDPNNVRLAQWQDLEEGMLNLEFPLASDTVLGAWKITAEVDGKQEKQEFKVEEYVLPKYEVIVKPPPFLLVTATEFEFELCAKYTYGEPVKGLVTANVDVVSEDWRGRITEQKRRPSAYRKAELDGCQKFQVDTQELDLSNTRHTIWKAMIRITATVTEDGTGVLLNGSDHSCKIERTPVQIKFQPDSPDYYKPYLPYYGKCTVTYPDGRPAPGELISIKMNSWHNGMAFQENYTTDSAGQFTFGMPIMDKPSAASLSIQAEAIEYLRQSHGQNHYYLNDARAYQSIKQWYSPSNSFIQMKPVEGSVACNSTLSVKIDYTTSGDHERLKFYYKVMSMGNIVQSGHKNHRLRRSEPRISEDAPLSSSFRLDVAVTPKLVSTAQLLVYYVRMDGEVVADSISFHVQECLENQVQLRFNQEEKFPGEQVYLHMTADPGSLCSVGAVDKSVSILAGNNRLTFGKVFSMLSKYKMSGNPAVLFQRDTYCEDKAREDDDGDNGRVPLPPVWGPPQGPAPRPMPLGRVRRLDRVRRSIWPGGFFSNYFDSIKAFQDHGAVALSDLILETRPCQQQPYVLYSAPMPRRGAGVEAAPGNVPPGVPGPELDSALSEMDNNNEPGEEPKQLELRNFFPETWLWDLHLVGDSGHVELQEELPHTITEWTASAFCSNQETGLGIAEPATIKAFQPFFMSFSLPYSVIRGETIPIPISVFNYLSECLAIKVSLEPSPQFQVAAGQSLHEVLCVCGQQSQTHRYNIMASALGEVNITVKAKVVENSDTCGNILISHRVKARDAVTRPLLVEPEGIEQESVASFFMCPNGGDTTEETIDLLLPSNLVPDSARGMVSVIGDVMGPALAGLDKLLKLPTGCGEQNMLKFAPNIFVMQYLTSTDQVTTEIETKALEFLRTGYQRELNYRHDDHSFSAFGNSDDEGSMWLTSFVVKSFAQARPFIYIDVNDVKLSMKWIVSQQLENGCFPQIGRVLHSDMKGGLAGNTGESNPATLTTYVLISLLEAGAPSSNEVIQNAISCINVQTWSDSYTMALVTYAFSLLPNDNMYFEPAMDRLRAMAINRNGVRYWENTRHDTESSGDDWMSPHHRAPSASVEMTAYALMAYLSSGSQSDVAEALPIVKWLTAQRNADGGFVSTQDTVVALQALAKFAAIIYNSGEDGDMSVQVSGTGIRETFHVVPNNRLVLQQQQIVVPNRIQLQTSGQGCVFAQASMKYNVYNDSENTEPAFRLRVWSERTSDNDCEYRNLHICARYTGNRQASDMTVIEAKMVTGWVPVKESVEKLLQDTMLGLKRFDIQDGATSSSGVDFYFDEMDYHEKCLIFKVYQEQETKNPKDKVILIYDYYDKDKSHVYKKYGLRNICGTKEELAFGDYEDFPGRDMSQRRQPPGPPRNMAENRNSGTTTTVATTTTAQVPGCPVCLREVPDDLDDQYCAANHAYKAKMRLKGRSSKLTVKLYKDFRPHRATPVQYSHVKPVIPSDCVCIFKDSESNVVILTSHAPEQSGSKPKKATLVLDQTTTVVPMLPNKKAVERRLKKAHRKCPEFDPSSVLRLSPSDWRKPGF